MKISGKCQMGTPRHIGGVAQVNHGFYHSFTGVESQGARVEMDETVSPSPLPRPVGAFFRQDLGWRPGDAVNFWGGDAVGLPGAPAGEELPPLGGTDGVKHRDLAQDFHFRMLVMSWLAYFQGADALL